MKMEYNIFLDWNFRQIFGNVLQDQRKILDHFQLILNKSSTNFKIS